ncbi:MAG TPA: hypothetical protein VJY37_01125 [Anaerovoracaceae bacterium]|nr:hypothetical protein [Anaerovoracaceae bacterium]
MSQIKDGVEYVDINAAYIDETVKIGKGTFIGPCVTLEGNTVIGENCKIYQNTRIKDSVIGDNVEIQSSVILDSRVGAGTNVGPFAYLRPGSDIGQNCKVGDFVEVKNSTMGDGSKASHLTYIGDSDVGSDVNIGCGVVFVNYDGTNKHRSTVEDGAFIGCNTNLVSPVTVGEGAYIAAGSTVTKDIPKDSLCVARAKENIIEGWAAKRGLFKKKK